MGNSSISSLVVWPQVINKIYCIICLGLMSSCVKPIRLKSGDQHRHKILVILAFFWSYHKSKKQKLPPSFINKHKSSTIGEKMKKTKM
jgi:hypothetical protein